jgi:hypothetical protein
MVQVHHDEGVANRIDPESCAVASRVNHRAVESSRRVHHLALESSRARVGVSRRPGGGSFSWFVFAAVSAGGGALAEELWGHLGASGIARA